MKEEAKKMTLQEILTAAQQAVGDAEAVVTALKAKAEAAQAAVTAAAPHVALIERLEQGLVGVEEGAAAGLRATIVEMRALINL